MRLIYIFILEILLVYYIIYINIILIKNITGNKSSNSKFKPNLIEKKHNKNFGKQMKITTEQFYHPIEVKNRHQYLNPKNNKRKYETDYNYNWKQMNKSVLPSTQFNYDQTVINVIKLIIE